MPVDGGPALPVPSEEWIAERVAELQALLERRTPKAATVLRRLFGRVDLQPYHPECGRDYYVAHTALDVFALVDSSGPGGGPDGGSGSFSWWTRSQRLRTVALVLIEAEFAQPVETPLYQSIATRVAAMRDRGDSVSEVARHLGVDPHTVDKALRWFRSR